MLHIAKRLIGTLLFAGVLMCFGYVAQQFGRTRADKPQAQNDPLAQLQMQVKDLQAAVDDLRSQQQVIAASAKESHELVLDSRIAQAQSRKDLNSVVMAVGRTEREIDQLGRQISSMMRDLQRVKTKVGLL
jgi:peptidoglycan hydrolase CwlO-like protein